MADLSQLGGWNGIDANQQLIASTMPTLPQAAPMLYAMPRGNEPVLLYKAVKAVNGSYPDYPAQEDGDCVGQGHAHANDVLQCVEIAAGERNRFQQTSTEFIYAASREVAGILGRGAGSYGSAAVKAMTTMGMASRQMPGADGKYSGQRTRDWGRTGAPAAVKSLAAAYKLGNAAAVRTWDDLVAAISAGFPVTICSNQGFTMTRDAQGFCDPRGSWAHCMFIAGIRFDREGGLCYQSWGSDTPTGPIDLDQPNYSFWIDRRVLERSILSAGDSWALSSSPDFDPIKLPPSIDWSIAA